jgi:hypothetical protein
MPHFCAGSSCPCASAVVRTFCKKHRGRGESSLSCGRDANRRSYDAIPQTKIGQGEKPARQDRLATNRPEGLGLQEFNSAAARSVRSSGDGESVGEFVKRFPNLQAEEIKNVLRGEGLLVDYQLHEHSLTLKAVELEAPKGPSAAVTAVEQSSGIGKEL